MSRWRVGAARLASRREEPWLGSSLAKMSFYAPVSEDLPEPILELAVTVPRPVPRWLIFVMAQRLCAAQAPPRPGPTIWVPAQHGNEGSSVVNRPVEQLEREARFRQRSFDRASHRYDAVSEVQRIMAARLVELASPGNEPDSVLEIGCGTGHLSEHLVQRWPRARLLFTDVSEAMLERARERIGAIAGGPQVCWRVLDARGADFALEERFSLVASSAVVQWFSDLRAHLVGVARHLLPEGQYLVSGFLPDNLPELARTLGRFGVTLDVGHSRQALEGASRAAQLGVRRFRTEAIVRKYANARELLDVLRTMGASRYPGKRPLTRQALGELMESYERDFAGPGGVRATWRVWYALLAR